MQKVCVGGGGGGGALYLDWELRSEAPWTNSLPLVTLKFWEKSHFWMFHEQSWQPQCFHSVGVPEEPRWADSACTPDWVRCVYLKATNTLGVNWKPAHILLVYDVNQLVGLIFYHQWPVLQPTQWWTCASTIQNHWDITEALKNIKQQCCHTRGTGQYNGTKPNHIFVFRFKYSPKQHLILP